MALNRNIDGSYVGDVQSQDSALAASVVAEGKTITYRDTGDTWKKVGGVLVPQSLKLLAAESTELVAGGTPTVLKSVRMSNRSLSGKRLSSVIEVTAISASPLLSLKLNSVEIASLIPTVSCVELIAEIASLANGVSLLEIVGTNVTIGLTEFTSS